MEIFPAVSEKCDMEIMAFIEVVQSRSVLGVLHKSKRHAGSVSLPQEFVSTQNFCPILPHTETSPHSLHRTESAL